MAKRVKKMIKLTYPEELIKEPLMFRMAKRYDVIPNIRRAKVTETVGELVVEISGEKEKVEKGLNFLKKKGVIVEPIEGDILE